MSEFVSGRHLLHTPGPTNLRDRVLRAMDRNAINHRGPDCGAVGREIVAKLCHVFQAEATIGIFPASGTGARESALVNTLAPDAHWLPPTRPASSPILRDQPVRRFERGTDYAARGGSSHRLCLACAGGAAGGDPGVLSFTGALAGLEMGLRAAGIPHTEGGVRAAMNFLRSPG